MKNFPNFFLLAFIFLVSCQKNTTLEGFDDQTWKADNNACKNQRADLVKILLRKKDELKKLDDDAVSDLLGAPERNRQFPKGMKNYIYFLYPGSQCKGDTIGKEGKKLVIEFDALGKTRIVRESLLDF